MVRLKLSQLRCPKLDTNRIRIQLFFRPTIRKITSQNTNEFSLMQRNASYTGNLLANAIILSKLSGQLGTVHPRAAGEPNQHTPLAVVLLSASHCRSAKQHLILHLRFLTAMNSTGCQSSKRQTALKTIFDELGYCVVDCPDRSCGSITTQKGRLLHPKL